MLGRFAGAVSSIGSAPEIRAARAPGTTVALENGFLSYAESVDTYRSGGKFCAAVGNPRFVDSAYALEQQTHGPAAAWISAFGAHGVNAPGRVRGRFAVVLVETANHEVTLATDRFGTWPVCYAESEGGLRFAERADEVPGASGELSPQALFEYFFFHVIPSPRTIFQGVSRLEPGHVLQWSAGTMECVRYWNPTFAETSRPSLAASRKEFLGLVEDAVARESAGWEAAAYLSGGTDSSTVAGMLCKVSAKNARTYSIGFDAPGYDEMEYARIASRHFGTEHHEHYVTPDALLAGIPQIATHYEQPFGNSSAVPAWICAQQAKDDGVEKLLAGDGGDELFGGNTRYAKQRVFGFYDNIPGWLRSRVIEPFLKTPGIKHIPPLRKVQSYVEQARVPLPDRLQMYNMILRIGPEEIFTSDFLMQIDPTGPLREQRATWELLTPNAPINRMLAFEWKYTLADNDLPKVIGTTQLAGIEVGFPLLADELLDFSLGLPPNWKLKGLTLRWFFKNALSEFLPPEIIQKKKHGFGLPFGLWAVEHTGLRTLAEETLYGLVDRGVVRSAFVDELLGEKLSAHPSYYGEMVWIMMMLELWLREQAPNWRLEVS